MVGHIDANEIRYNNHNKSYYFSNDQLEMLTFIVKKSVHKGDKNSFKYKKEKEEMQQAFSALQNARSKLEKCANLNSMIFSSCNSPVIINEVAKETKKMQDEATKKIKDAVKVIEKNCSSYRSYLDISRIPNDLEHKVNNQKYKFVAEKSDLSYSKSIETTWNDFGIPYKNANALSEIAYSEFYEKAPKNKIKNEDVKIIEIEKINSLLEQQIPENQKNKLKEALNAYAGLEKLQNELLECKRANNIINSNFYLDGAILESVIRNITKYGEKLQNEIVSYKEKVDRKYLPIIENTNEINSTRKQEQRLDEINKKAMEGTIEPHIEGDVPNILLTMDNLNEYTLGHLIYFFELACAMSGKLLGVNPFNQPGVEKYKKNMFRLLGKPGYEEKGEEKKEALEKLKKGRRKKKTE